jgi:hypothetical protein
MSKVHDAIGDLLAAEIESRRAWDEPPQLYDLYLDGTRPYLSAVPLPEYIWDEDATGRRTADTLRMIAEGYRQAARGRPYPDDSKTLHGAAFRHEGWMVAADKPDELSRRRLGRQARAHRLHEHPARVEVRLISCVDRAGITYMSSLERGGVHARQLVTYPGGDLSTGEQLTGTVVGALDVMVAALTGFPAQRRRDDRI